MADGSQSKEEVARLRILILNWRDINHPQAGGAERYVHEIGRRLARKHEITFLCAGYPEAADEETIDGLRVVRRGGRFSVYLYAAKVLMSTRGYDLVIDDINGIPFFSPVLTRAPVISIIHHIVGKEIFQRELPFPLSAVGCLAERSIPRFYRRCTTVTVSESTKEELCSLGLRAENIVIIQNGVDITCSSPPAPRSDAPLVAYFGRIKDYKRVDHVIRAFKPVHEQFPQARLAIAGRGKEDELIDLARELGIEGAVDFMGELDEDGKQRLLSSAWLFVTASMKEGWGLAVIEANACGTPAIAYNVPGLRDSIVHGENGLLIPDGDLAGFSEAIIKMLKDDEGRRQMGKRAEAWASRFSWDSSAALFEEVIERVVSKGRE